MEKSRKKADVPKGLSEEQRKRWEENRKKGEELRKKMREDRKKEEDARPTKHTVYFITMTGNRYIAITLTSENQYPDDATLKTVTDSFEFL